jgi:hypothetical protein
MREAPTGFAAPADTPRGSICGICAAAVVAGVSFREAKAVIERDHEYVTLNKGRSTHRGSTNRRIWMRAIEHFGVELEEVGGYPLGRTSLVRFARFLNRDETYLVHTTGHVQVVRAGWVVDQRGAKHVSEFWGRRKRVLGAWRVAR